MSSVAAQECVRKFGGRADVLDLYYVSGTRIELILSTFKGQDSLAEIWFTHI